MNSGMFDRLNDLDDFDLVVACQNNVEPAFNVLYKRYLRYVHGVLCRLAPDLSQSHDDLVQEVFLRVWKSIDTLRNPRVFKTWLTRLITNLFYDQLRRRPKDVVISIDAPARGTDDDDEGPYLQIADSKDRPDQSCEHDEIIVQVNAALQHLPQHSQKVIVLREFYGLSYDEIARCSKIQVGTVK